MTSSQKVEELCASTQVPSTVPQIQLQLEKLRNVKGGLSTKLETTFWLLM